MDSHIVGSRTHAGKDSVGGGQRQRLLPRQLMAAGQGMSLLVLLLLTLGSPSLVRAYEVEQGFSFSVDDVTVRPISPLDGEGEYDLIGYDGAETDSDPAHAGYPALPVITRHPWSAKTRYVCAGCQFSGSC